MPVYKTINFNTATQILVWKITESFEQLFNEVQLNEKSKLRLNGMKSVLHQRAFLSVRKLLQEIGYTDYDLFYDEFGKPHLNDGNHISITHSHEFSALIISNQKVGIDIEMQREKIKNIADKFIDYEFNYLNKEDTQDYLSKLTVIWGVKESIFKIRNEPGISFKKNIKVNSFQLANKQALAWLKMDMIKEPFSVFFEEIENFTLVYAFEK
ncbi:4'-phosphopantetheinyl transferase family protein [Flavobacterium luteum]|uniref:4'-phosphopantetheinyl transferase superfamily protein n=1 Tax=Flavobacterium luteum TaxID=2026654 RepID=A0A7J5AEX4_9FLAO|nr:4'-phosphopantetheinyl transferase superfamily protein [Flavobacterium luteum]KAB1156110.1 4'-phosphopantetheinyl transferase superfamily protein [Flavobacterium luteum]